MGELQGLGVDFFGAFVWDFHGFEVWGFSLHLFFRVSGFNMTCAMTCDDAHVPPELFRNARMTHYLQCFEIVLAEFGHVIIIRDGRFYMNIFF